MPIYLYTCRTTPDPPKTTPTPPKQRTRVISPAASSLDHTQWQLIARETLHNKYLLCILSEFTSKARPPLVVDEHATPHQRNGMISTQRFGFAQSPRTLWGSHYETADDVGTLLCCVRALPVCLFFSLRPYARLRVGVYFPLGKACVYEITLWRPRCDRSGLAQNCPGPTTLSLKKWLSYTLLYD